MVELAGVAVMYFMTLVGRFALILVHEGLMPVALFDREKDRGLRRMKEIIEGNHE